MLATLSTSPVLAGALVRFDAVTAVMLSLIALVGAVVVRYSWRYLSGDPNRRGAMIRLAATLTGVLVVVVANDLVLLGVAWAATSLALHGLLTHARHRPVAVAVAHKKFVLARAADLCVAGAVVAFSVAWGTTRLDRLDRLAGLATDGPLPTAAQVGALLVAMAAVLKCAQLPFHGWLIQVMEAPTPVSALLHAGVVNLGGLVLLRLAPVVDRAVAAQTLLVVVGGLTAVVAALVMTTRVSVKVSLAWSTCAQMGIMLVQCGLGLWELALLHLVAHSLYKAHRFLRAGSTVTATMRHRLLGHTAAPSAGEVAVGLAVGASVTAATIAGWVALPVTITPSTAGWLFVGATGLAAVNLAIAAPRTGWAAMAPRIAVLLLASFALHEVAARAVEHGPTPPAALIALTVALVVTLFVAQAAIALAPHSSAVVRARAWLFRGLFLDEAFTRLVFAAWPPPAPAPAPPSLTAVRTEFA
ncbi:MAG: NADH-quinone oxidoreductase subunit L [Acidimicrobiales bacterium]